ncbi:MAG: DUF1559 domain-containing protein [Planctomycetaceae bacterium]|nr:DUF1559 domain-containing protein [Planctomycetaceae bacterium]
MPPQCPVCHHEIVKGAVACGACGTRLQSPSGEPIVERPTRDDRGPGVTPWAVLRVVAVVIAVMACISILLPLLQHRRGHDVAYSKTQSKNNLKQIGLASHNYHDQYGNFPIGGTFDDEGRGLHSWQTRLLPFVDEQALYDGIDLQAAWNDPVNSVPFAQVRGVYCNRSFPELSQPVNGFALSAYAGNSEVLLRNAGIAIRDFRDGASNTLLAGEVAEGFKPWGDPTNVRNPADGVTGGPLGFGGPKRFPYLLFADGSVKSFSKDVSADVLKALATPAGGEPVDPNSY